MSHRWWIIALAGLLLLASGCAVATEPVAIDTGQQTPVNPTPQRPQPPREGMVAQDFALPDLDGNMVALSQFRGRRVLLNFWASWCVPCRQEIPVMVDLYDELRAAGIEIVAVNVLEEPGVVAQAARHYGMPFPVLLDESGAIQRTYFVRGLPTTYLVDEDGVIRVIHRGELTAASLRGYARSTR
jgi:peroxiredoxin